MKLKIALLVSSVACLFLLLLQFYLAFSSESFIYLWHHQMADDIDSSIGESSLPDDYIVDDSFTSHLPLIVIDTHGKEIINYKYYDSSSDSFRYEDGVDPYCSITIHVFDSEQHVNQLTDIPTYESNGKIKIRGNSSSALDKKQYRLHLLDDTGDKVRAPLLGLDPGAEWVLNGTQRDYTYMRNYLAYNLAHMLDAYSPEVRYCEVLKKVEGGYLYEGIYLLIEPIEQGEGRVAISNYDPGMLQSSYLLRRDRVDPSEFALVTYADTSGISQIWAETVSTQVQLSLAYPKESRVTNQTVEYIQDDISEIEEVIYSSNPNIFSKYPEYIDVESFIDYFILNEFSMSYDAGLHSTYMYKDVGGKLVMGPYWDFDGGWDNSSRTLTNFRYVVMCYRPYYDRLCTDKAFVDQLLSRYRYLRKGILSDEYISDAIESTVEFLGNAISRDRQRWGDDSSSRISVLTEDLTQLEVDRSRSVYEEEVMRLSDTITLHNEYMDKNLATQLTSMTIPSATRSSLIGWLVIVVFFVSVILVQRVRKGQ